MSPPAAFSPLHVGFEGFGRVNWHSEENLRHFTHQKVLFHQKTFVPLPKVFSMTGEPCSHSGAGSDVNGFAVPWPQVPQLDSSESSAAWPMLPPPHGISMLALKSCCSTSYPLAGGVGSVSLLQ